MNGPNALHLFSTYHGFDYGLLSGDDRYEIANTNAGFDGRVFAIRLTEKGRFGNVFYQILHAILLARSIGCAVIELFPFQGGPPQGQETIQDLTFVCASSHQTSRPTLVGHFFNSYVFQSALTGFDPDLVLETIDVVLRPLFRHLLNRAVSPLDGTLVMNFRGGDIFKARPVPRWYVQPPASYYLRSALYAREVAGVDRVRIVAEDRLNPALPVTEAMLHQAGFKLDCQTGSLEDDLTTLLQARHIVSPFGTMCEAVAMLSTHLRTYFAFRQFESHRHLHTRRSALLTYVMQARGVRPVRLSDIDWTYIAPRSWEGTDGQIELLRNFPLERVTVQDLSIESDATDDCFERFPPSPVMTAAAEAYHLRRALIAVRQELTALTSERTACISELETRTAEAQVLKQELANWRATFIWKIHHRLMSIVSAPSPRWN